MKNFNHTEVQTILSGLIVAKNSPTLGITPESIAEQLEGRKGTTFATITLASKIKTASAHKHRNIYKVSRVNVTLCNTESNLYINAVSKEIGKQYTPQESKFYELNNCYSLVGLKTNMNKFYVRGNCNYTISSTYYDADSCKFTSNRKVADLLTPSAAEQLLAPKTKTKIQHADIEHKVQTRTFALENIYSITLNDTTLTAVPVLHTADDVEPA